MPDDARDSLLEVEALRTWIGDGERTVRAVDGVSFSIRRGETFALLGESGCGKSMTALSIMGLVPRPAGRIVSGSVRLDGRDLLRLPGVRMRDVRGRRIAMIFQEPMTSLNPVLTVGAQIGEVLRRHLGLRGRRLQARVMELLEAVGIPDPARRIREYPHQLSGGMKQRVMIAMALACKPDLLIADEPTTALDVTIQAQVLELLDGLRRETGMAVLLITHDLGVVAERADRVAVMYAGQIVEQAPRDAFFREPRHPYSRKLFESLPDKDKRDQPLAVIPGSVPTLAGAVKGCRFAPRCELVWDACRREDPGWTRVGDAHRARCHWVAGGRPETAGQGVAAPPAAVESNDAGSGLASLFPSAARPSGARRLARTSPLHAPALAAPSPRPAIRAPHGGELLVVRDLKVHFPIHKGLFKRVVGHVRAVDGVSFRIRKGRTLALVGESGCGKTTVGKGILQLVRPTAGSVRFEGTELTRLKGRALRRRRSDFQVIFQDPFSSMNPRMMVGDIIEEGMVTQGIGRSRDERRARVDELLEQVGLSPDVKKRYPHEFSGGQRQRICIARALAVNPKLIVCDEPTSALDVSVQAQILNLLKGLQDELGLSYLFITHNLSVVAYLAQEVAVMYLGRIVERGTVDEVLDAPEHPYTQALLSAVPVVDPDSRREIIRLEGELPSPVDPPAGCHFHPRCPRAMAVCRESYPGESKITDTHVTRCHRYT